MGILPYVSNAVLQIADAEGFFAEQGLSVEFVTFKSSTELIPLLLRGDIDVATPALTASFFNSVASGAKIRMVLPLNDSKIQDCANVAFMARKSDVDAGTFADPASWRDARLCLATLGATDASGYIVAQALEPAGLSVGDITVERVDMPAQPEALRAGQVDILLSGEPWITRMMTDGDIVPLMPAETLVPDMVVSMIAYGARPLEDIDLGVRFATAFLKAVRRAQEGKTPRNVELVAEYTSLDPSLVEKLCWAHSAPDGKIDVSPLMGYQEWLLEQKVVDRVLDPTEFLDARFAEEADRILSERAR